MSLTRLALLRPALMTLGLFALGVSSAPAQTTASPVPSAPRKPHTITLHGETIEDPFFWLKDKTNPETIDYLNAENAYTESAMKSTKGLQDSLYREYLSRIKQTDLSVPYRERGYWYYSKSIEGKQYSVNCRKKGSLDASEEIVLDVNELAVGQKFMSAFPSGISDDGNLLAFVSDTTGFREYYVSIKDLRSGKLLEDRFVKASNVTWAADNRTLFYVTEDAAKRAHKLWRHTIGEPKARDTLIYEEKDELYRLGVHRSKDRQYLFMSSRSATTTEERYLAANNPQGEFKIILPRKDGHDYSVDHRDGQWYIRTNHDGATNFKLVTCPVSNPDPKGWKAFLPYNPAVMIGGVSLFKDFAVVSEREAGIPHLRVIDFSNGRQYRMEFPEPVYSVSLAANPEYDTSRIHLTYTSMVTPVSVFEYDLKTKERKLLKRQEIPAGYDASQYQSEWVFATAPDGTKVPVSLVYKKGVKRDGTAPCFLTGYGSYGSTTNVAFSPTRLSLLDRGVIFAQGHIRGGSDLGRTWYDDGKMMKKMNTFTDFIACADFLVNEKYCDRGKLVIQGASAGGLLIGATISIRPDLCKAAILQVPFVDVINTMLDESLPLTVQEFLEWGNPKKKEEYDYIRKYCPYTNLKAKKYPAMLVLTSLNDSQVLYHEPAKYTAKMRYVNPEASILLKCNMAGGHGGSSGRYDALKEQAFLMAFSLSQMGISK
ncbi:MAG: S9 family peptidase [Gemmataceae bacterium]